MQYQLPLFPTTTKLINPSVGVYENDGLVYYLHNGSPIFCHSKDDKNSFMYITGNLVETKLCLCSEISRALGIKVRNIERYAQKLREEGSNYFFKRVERRGQCHKVTDNVISKLQSLLNEGYSQQLAAKKVGLSEGAVRYHLRNGRLKKKQRPKNTRNHYQDRVNGI